MTALVFDASVLVKLLLPEADSERAFAVAEICSIVVPELALIEVANALWTHVRSHALDLDQALCLLNALVGVRLDVRPMSDLLSRALRLAAALDHPIYDCIYLALAEALDVALVTADNRLVRAVSRSHLQTAVVRTLAEFA